MKLIQVRQDFRVKRGESRCSERCSKSAITEATGLELPLRYPVRSDFHHPDYPGDRSAAEGLESGSPGGNRLLVRKPHLGWLLRVVFASGFSFHQERGSSTAAVEKSVEKIRVNAPKFCCIWVYSKMHTCVALHVAGLGTWGFRSLALRLCANIQDQRPKTYWSSVLPISSHSATISYARPSTGRGREPSAWPINPSRSIMSRIAAARP